MANLQKYSVPRSIKNLGFLLAVLLLTAGAVYAVNAALTFSSTSVVSDGALTLTGAGASTWDIGNNTLSVQTTNNGAITTGTGLFTVAGIMKLQGSASYLQLNGIAGNPSTVSAGDVWYNTTQKSLRFGSSAGAAGVVSLLNVTTSDSSAITATSDTNFSQNFSIPANALTAGKRLRITASGYYSTGQSQGGSCTGQSPANCLTLNLKYGSTTLASTGQFSISSQATNSAWMLEAYVTVRSAGASGSAITNGFSMLSCSSNCGANTNMLGNASGASAVTIDTTTATNIQLSAGWNQQGGSNTITMQDFSVEVMD